MSANQLSTSLDNLAKVSSVTSTSFQQLRANFISYSNQMAGIGLNNSNGGGFNAGIIEGMATEFQGVQVLSGTARTANIFSSLAGQAMVASRMGISVTQMYSQLHSSNPVTKINALAAGDSFIKQQLLQVVGGGPEVPGFEQRVMDKAIQLVYVLEAFVPPTGGQEHWDEQTAVEYTKRMLRGQGGMVNSMVTGTEQKLLALSDNKPLSTMAGSNAFWRNVNKDFQTKYGKDVARIGTDNMTQVSYQQNGSTKLAFGADISRMDLAQRTMIEQQLESGQASLRSVNSKGQQGRWHTLGQTIGDSLLNAQEQQKVKLELTPGAQQLVHMINNPGSVTQNEINNIRRRGGQQSPVRNSSQGGGHWWDEYIFRPVNHALGLDSLNS